MEYGIALFASIALVLANAFFVASEFAIVKIRPSRLEQLALGGARRARSALAISRRLDDYLSASQLGITLASLALGWIGEPVFEQLLAGLFADFRFWPAGTTHTVAFVASLTIITCLHVVLGELVPKSLAIQRTEPMALWTAAPLRIFYWVTFPVTWTLNAASRLVLRLLGLRRTSPVEMLHSPEELRLILKRVELEPATRQVIDRLFDYSNEIVKHVMTPRRDVVALDAARSWDENLGVALRHQYARYPVIEGVEDRVLGYVHLKDIVTVLGSGRRPRSLLELLREPLYVSEQTSIELLLGEFLRQRVHLAVIKDHAQTFVGIVTMDDILEEFVGEIRDEYDSDMTRPGRARSRGLPPPINPPPSN